MSTHPTILGGMVRNQTAPDETTSLDVGRGLGIPDGFGADPDEAAAARPALLDPGRQPGQRRQRIESE